MPQQARPRIRLTRDQKSVVGLLFVGLVLVVAVSVFVDASWRDMTSLRAKAESYPSAFYAPLGGETSLWAAIIVVFITSFFAAVIVDKYRKIGYIVGLLGVLLGAFTALSPLGRGYIITSKQAIVFGEDLWRSSDIYNLDKAQPTQAECQVIPRHPEDSYRLVYRISVAHGNVKKEIDIARGVDAVTVKSWLHVLPVFDLSRRPAPDEFGPPPLPNDGARSKECEEYYGANLDPNERDILHALLDLGINPFDAAEAPS